MGRGKEGNEVGMRKRVIEKLERQGGQDRNVILEVKGGGRSEYMRTR